MRIFLPLRRRTSAPAREAKKEDGKTSRPLGSQGVIYLMLPYSLTVMVTAGMAVMSLETVTVPSNMAFTRAL